MTRDVFEPYIDVAQTWLDHVRQTLALAPSEEQRALHAFRAGLHAIRDRLPAGEVLDLGAQLPTLIRGIYLDGWTLTNDPTRIRDRAAILARVKRELAPDPRLAPSDVLRAVILVLTAHVSAGEIDDVLATLPAPIKTMWSELAAPAPAASASTTRRTGYSR